MSVATHEGLTTGHRGTGHTVTVATEGHEDGTAEGLVWTGGPDAPTLTRVDDRGPVVGVRVCITIEEDRSGVEVRRGWGFGRGRGRTWGGGSGSGTDGT